MPNKHNADRWHHFGKMKFKIRNWASYEAGLRRRGSLTLWVTDEAIAKWQAPPRQSQSARPIIRIWRETALMLRLAAGKARRARTPKLAQTASRR
jgi:hypothetical protein